MLSLQSSAKSVSGSGDQVIGVAVGLAGLDSQLLGLVHGADIQTEQDDQQDGDDGEHTVQVELEHAEIQVIGTHAGEVQGGDLGGQQTHQVHAVITDGDIETSGAPMASVM